MSFRPSPSVVLRSGVLISVAAFVLGCGSQSAPKYLSTVPSLPQNATPTQIVQRAYLLLGHSSYRESVHVWSTYDTSALPPAEANRVQATAAQNNANESAVAAITDFRNFQMTLHANGRTVYLKASGGNYSSSTDGLTYQAVSASTVAQLVNVMQAGVTTAGRKVTSVQDAGPRRVDGVAVEEYVAVLPPAAVGQSVAGLLSQLPRGGYAYGAEHERLDLTRSTGVPVRITSTDTLSLNLSAMHRPGVTGVLKVLGNSQRTFTAFRAR